MTKIIVMRKKSSYGTTIGTKIAQVWKVSVKYINNDNFKNE